MAKNSDSKNKKQKSKIRKKHPILFGIFTFFFCIFVALSLTFIIVGTYMLSYMHNSYVASSVTDLDNYKNNQSQTSILYVTNTKGKTVEEARLHGSENRIWAEYDEMPENLTWAFVCLEDKRFYEHSGVDWIRTIAVAVKPSYSGQGGSTITQQLIKNLTFQNQNTYNRKFNEILKALNLERYYSKKDILEAYLNTVYLGAGAYGVETAAETYFGKNVSELSLPECAMLAGITKAPYTLNPYYDFDACKERQELCLSKMLEEEKITKKQYDKAVKTKIKLVNKTKDINATKEENIQILSWYDEYVIDQVIADLQEKYNYEYSEAYHMVYYGGLSIYSAEDQSVQNTLEDIYINRSGFPSARHNRAGYLPNSSMTIMDYSGRIVALVGGTGEKTVNRAYNRATNKNAKRQPGSSIKPLSVYAPAVNEGLVSPSSLILEKAITVDGRTWPRNFNGDHGSGSNITVQEALVRSLNTVPARILKEMLGLDTSYKYANEAFHLNLSNSDKTYSGLAVGGTYTGVTTLEMASAFATFGNGGQYFKPYSYFRVVDRNGEVILDNRKNEGEQVITSKTANSLLSMMKAAVVQSNGTGYGSKISGFETFAKTGTTSDNCDKWYCGGTPYYVASVWYGYDIRDNLYTGSTNPAKNIFHYTFSKLHEGLEERTFEENLEALGISSEGVESVIVPTKEPETTEEETEEEETSEKETTEKETSDTTEPSTSAATTEEPTSKSTTEPSTSKVTTEAPISAHPTEEPTSAHTTEPSTTKATTEKPTEAPTSSQDSDDEPSHENQEED